MGVALLLVGSRPLLMRWIATSGAGATLSVVPAPETVIFLNDSTPTRHIPDTVWILTDAHDRQLGREIPVLRHFPAHTVIMTGRFPPTGHRHHPGQPSTTATQTYPTNF